LMYYKDAVLNELKSIKSIPSSYIDNKGLKIYTNLDLNAQNELESSIKEEIPNESKVQVASVMMKPETGRIIALVGGRDYNYSEYNRAISAKRQVGSTMKPFLYYAALENGFTPSSSFISQKTTFTFNDKDKYSPQNYNEKYANKPISMATAIAYSDNIYAVKTNLFLGSDALINVVKRLGINEKLPAVPSLPLGTKEINIIDMTKGYAAFANLGKKIEPHFIQKIEDNDGNVLYEVNEESEQVLNSSLTFILNNMLTATYDPLYVDYNYPTAISLATKLKHTYGLKSGTTESDNWHIGFNDDIITSVWVGYDDNTPLKTTEYKYGQNIWFKATEKYEEGKEDIWYETPKNVNLVYVDPISGNLVDENAKVKKGVYFLKGSEPTSVQEVFDEKKDIPHEA
ncbi:MAG: monofunctional biosynthetic peptidoglycan transglycosylase, partial [Bacilli bacterium]|nr:monofunctional biosynthetic peptidoglycan transglycosylase [Bacilli bacterium]